MIRRRTPLLQPRKKPQRVSSDRLYIREHRQRRDVKLTELAKAIGKSKGLMSQIENGSCDPSVETLGQIAGFFGLAHRGMLFEPPAIAARPSSSPKTITAKAFPAIHDLHSFT